MICGELLQRTLRVSRVEAVYGPALPGLRSTRVDDVATARLLALAHERVNRGIAMVHLGDGVFARAEEGDGPEPVPLRSPADIVALVAAADPLRGPPAFRLELDPSSPAPDSTPPPPPPPMRWAPPDDQLIARIQDIGSLTVLAGPGVVAAGAQAGLNAFAVAASVGVLNTWGAKGVFDWRSRHHLATIGLQARDFELGGLEGAELIVATGLDPHEAPDDLWQRAPFVTVEPTALAPLAEAIDRPYRSIPEPQLRSGLARVTQEGWTADAGPLAPSRVTLHYGQCLAGGGLLAADAGVGGYWAARTFSTTELGATSIPSQPRPGFAVASVVAARLMRPWRPALAVVDGGVDPESQAVLDAASSLGVSVGVEVWDPDGITLDADQHVERLTRLAHAATHTVASLQTDPGQLDRMLEVAGPVVAWGGLESPGSR
jgi:hypothetical protein